MKRWHQVTGRAEKGDPACHFAIDDFAIGQMGIVKWSLAPWASDPDPHP
jgi:hypothetical protein